MNKTAFLFADARLRLPAGRWHGLCVSLGKCLERFMFQSTSGRPDESTEGVTPLPCKILPLKGEVSNRSQFLMNASLALCPPSVAPEDAPVVDAPDFLGRMPVPLRRPFKARLDRALSRHRAAGGAGLTCAFLAGAQWHESFDRLAEWPAARLPAMLVTTLHTDMLAPALLARYAPKNPLPPVPLHPACEMAGLRDERGVFRSFSLVPFVWLVDEKRLNGRPLPRVWSDLLRPMWADEIVFGGWRPDEQGAYREYNAWLLLCLYREFGEAGLVALAENTRHLRHNIRIATQAGSNSRQVGAIAILPWLQAELCPRRERTRVVWPEDGALAMPISYLVKRHADGKVAPLVDYVCGAELGAMLARNCYPPTQLAAGAANAFPPDIRLKWPGWDYIYGLRMAADSGQAARVFFSAWHARQGSCGMYGGQASCN
jgi:ABC-type Fe3+ transport system substrate-binding protein